MIYFLDGTQRSINLVLCIESDLFLDADNKMVLALAMSAPLLDGDTVLYLDNPRDIHAVMTYLYSRSLQSHLDPV